MPNVRPRTAPLLACLALAAVACAAEGDGDGEEGASAASAVESCTKDRDLDGIMDCNDPAPDDPYNVRPAAAGTMAHQERHSSVTSSSPSWDGRLYFGVKPLSGGAYGFIVTALRPEALFDAANPAYGLPDFSRSGVWSPTVMIGAITGQTSHLTTFAEPAAGAENPYRSACSSMLAPARDANGACLTYRFGLVTAKQTPNPPPGGNDTALAIVYGTVVVQSPDTASASVLFAGFDKTDADFLLDTTGARLCRYEPSISVDGHLLVWHGCVDNNPKSGISGGTAYSFNPNAGAVTGWSPALPISKMYATHGAGAGANEPIVNGVRFSDRYPIGKKPLLDPVGQPLEDFNGGPYPWLGFDGSEIFFPQVVVSPGAPSRTAVSAIGARTNWRMQHLDGAVNPSRTRLTEDPYGFVFEGTPEYDYLVAAYNKNLDGEHSLTTQLFGTTSSSVTMGVNNWQRIFMGPVAQSWSKWTPFGNDASPLPRDKRPGVFGFLLSHSSRYVEVNLSTVEDGNYVLQLPMNELTVYDHALQREVVAAARAINAGTKTKGDFGDLFSRERSEVLHSATMTGDTVAMQHGTLGGGAKFPFEFDGAQARWKAYYDTVVPTLGTSTPAPLPKDSSAVAGDRTQGAVGNAIYFPRAGTVTSTLTSANLSALAATHQNTIELWARELKNTSGARYHLFTGANATIDVSAGQIVAQSTGGGTVTCQAALGTANAWHHVALTRSFAGGSGKLQLYVDGAPACVQSPATDPTGPGTNPTIVVGPNDASGPNDLTVLIDEVAISKVARTADEIRTTALRYLPPATTATTAASFAPDGTTLPAPLADAVARVPAGETLSASQVGAIAELGRELFTDPALSADGTVSCATCHDPTRAFTDGRMCGAVPCKTSKGVGGALGPRNAPGIANRLFGAAQFWDGRAGSLELQVGAPLTNAKEMGNASVAAVVSRISSAYSAKFASAFGSSGVDGSRLGMALATYERTVLSGDARYDRRLLTPAERRGEELFFGKARCSSCHRGPTFSDELFHNNGIDTSAAGADLGRMAITQRASDRGKFKTPSLRDVAKTAPYFHDGRFATLANVVDFYDAGGDPGAANRDLAVQPLGLSTSEKSDLVAFLGTLSGSTTNRSPTGELLPARPEIVANGVSSSYGAWLVGWSYDSAGAPTVEIDTTPSFAAPRTVGSTFLKAGTPSGYTGTTWQNLTWNIPTDMRSGSVYARVRSGTLLSAPVKVR